MISRRLTKNQKDAIVEAYRGGENTNSLAEKYNCSSNTINRTVKTLLSDTEYKLLKGKRSKITNKKTESIDNDILDCKEEEFEPINSFNSPSTIFKEEQSINTNNDFSNSDFNEIAVLPIEGLRYPEHQNDENSDAENLNYDPANNLEEIVPLISTFDFEKKQLDFEIHDPKKLPECVYMLVDKKVELEVKAISDLPEWSFLPENELKRNALILFSNQRTAKRNCSKNQRVIKIPNTSVFEVSKSYLVLKGITRLILEESIIALDN